MWPWLSWNLICIPSWPGPHIGSPNPYNVYLFTLFFKFNFKNIYLFYVSMYMRVGTCTPENNPWELVLSVYQMGFGNGTHVARQAF